MAYYGLLVDLKHKRLIDPLTSLKSLGTVHKTSVYSVSTLSINQPHSALLSEFIDITKPMRQAHHVPDCIVAHRILVTCQPIAERPRKLAGEKLIAAKAEIDFMLNQGILQPSSSPWASPIHLVKKKTGGWRTCGDYRKFNANTTPDRYPPPLIQDLFHRLSNKSIFTTLDLERAYYQIPMATEDVQKTAIITPFGLYEFLVMPFSLRNATQTCQRYIDSIFRDLNFVFCYIDDIIIMSQSTEEHLNHLRQVFNRLRRHRLTINVSKCVFIKPEVVFLSYNISQQGYQPTADRVQAIIDYQKSETIIDLRRFLGKINYYRHCLPHAAHLQAPLNAYFTDSKTNYKRKILWTPQTERVFEDCKQSIIKLTYTTFPSSSAPLTLTTDASDIAIGAVLEQFEDGV